MKIAVVSVLAVLVLGAAVVLLLRSKPDSPALPPVVAHAADEAREGPVRLWSEEAKGFVTLPRVVKSEEEWRRQLTELQYDVLREGGTERAFTGAYAKNRDAGIYRCAACGTDLFHADTKFESGTGWPSFWKPIAPGNVVETVDRSWFMVRTEVSCARCGGHLGHVFPDGPPPTGLRYCMNSASLQLVKR